MGFKLCPDSVTLPAETVGAATACFARSHPHFLRKRLGYTSRTSAAQEENFLGLVIAFS